MKDDLFVLIKSLSAPEKRYFKMQAKAYGKGARNYLELFEAIDDQEVYDEGEIKALFEGEAFVKQFSVAKNTLMYKLKDGLRNYYNGSTTKSVEMQLRENLDHLEIFLMKKMYAPMLKLLKRSKKLAIRYQEFVYLYLLLLKEQFYLISQKAKNVEEEIKELTEEMSLVLHKIDLENQFERLNKQVFVQLKLDRDMAEAERLELWDEVLKHPLLQDEAKAITFLARRFYHNIKGFYCTQFKRHKEAYQHYAKVIDCWKETPYLQKNKRTEYLSAICNYMTGCFITGDHEEYAVMLDILKKNDFRQGLIDAKNVKTIVYHEVLYYLTSKKIREGIFEAPRILRLLASVEADMHRSRLIVVYYNLSMLFFLGGRADRSIDMLQCIINQPKIDAKPAIIRFAKLFLVILYHEESMATLVSSQYRSVYRNISSPSPFEACLLKNLKLLDEISTWSRSQRSAYFRSFMSEISAIEAANDKKHITGAQEVALWAESQLTGKSVGEIYGAA